MITPDGETLMRQIGTLLVILMVAATSRGADDAPLPPFFLAKETTFFSGPLRRDGTVDYIAAINEELGRGATKENNAAIPLLEAVVAGPEAGRAVHYARVWTKLGLNGAPKTAGVDAGPIDPNTLDETGKGPWVAGKSPETAKWLDASKARLDLMVEASQRSRFYMPLIREREEDSSISILLPHLNEIRGLANALRSRAMLRLGSDDTDGFVADVTALVRLGRLMTQAPTLVEKLVGIGVETMGLDALRIAATGGWLSEKQARGLLAELDATVGLARSVFDSFGLTERTFILEFLQFAAVHGAAEAEKMLIAFAGGGGGANKAAMVSAAAGSPVKDWNAALKKSNAWYDRIAGIEKETTYAARQVAARAILKDLEALKSPTEGWRAVLAPLEDRTIVLLLPVIERVVTRQARIDAEREVTRTAIALSAYRSVQGRYPAGLNDLTPGYVRSAPVDPFTARGLTYRTTGDGYVLLSVGPDGEEQPATARNADDIAVRVGK
jgi:hypothetical protein